MIRNFFIILKMFFQLFCIVILLFLTISLLHFESDVGLTKLCLILFLEVRRMTAVWAERDEFDRQEGWRMTAGQRGVSLTAKRGGG